MFLLISLPWLQLSTAAAPYAGEMPGASELLAKAAGSFPLYAFTNSNREHEQYWSKQFSGILGNFKEVYVSSTIGLRKPEAEAYDYVVRAIGVSANRIVFFDDTVENIEGARARGLQAVHVKSGADLADALAVLIERSRGVRLCCQGNRRVGKPYCVL